LGKGVWEITYGEHYPGDIPSVQFGDVWKEFPKWVDKWDTRLSIICIEGLTVSGYVKNGEFIYIARCSENPIDALIDLLIWTKKGKDETTTNRD
jgi:hypothetical protein